tara:strand:+ start:2043 stop:2453 length:411 start_codon:yes stop_codon:yes gene_type:complete
MDHNENEKTIREVFHEFTADIVEGLQQNSGKTDNTATVVLGVSIGMLVSAVIAILFVCIGRYLPRLDRRTRVAPHNAAASPSAREVNVQLNAESPTLEMVANTEGAYRSDSDASDDGEGAKATIEAQKRSRMTSVV